MSWTAGRAATVAGEGRTPDATGERYALMESRVEPPLAPPLWDAMLRLAPVNVLLFDTELICRYAAPVGTLLMGKPPAEWIGRPAPEVLPPAANGLAAPLRLAAATADAASWRSPEYRFALRLDGIDQPCCWSIQIDPLVVESYRGVLVTWSDILDAVTERAQVEAQLAALAAQREQRATAITALLSDLRNLVTPISGYLQVMARRPATLAGRPFASVITENVLPRLDDLLVAIDRLRRPPIADDDP